MNTSHKEWPVGHMRGYGDPPSPPRNTNPFRAHQGYGLHDEDLPSQRRRLAASPVSVQMTMPPFLHGSNRTWSSSFLSGPPRLTTPPMRSPPSGSNRTARPLSGTDQFPPVGYQMPQNYQGLVIQNQGERYPSPTSPSTYQNQGRILSPSTSGQMTPTNQTLSLTQSTNEGTATPSMQEGATMSGPLSPTSTERSSVHTEPLPGNSDSGTSTPEQVGPIPYTPESIWTTTSPRTLETNPWAEEIAREAFTIPGLRELLPKSTPTGTDPSQAHRQATEFEMAYENEPTPSRHASSPTSEPSYSSRSSDSNSFESFQPDEAMFGNAI